MGGTNEAMCIHEVPDLLQLLSGKQSMNAVTNCSGCKKGRTGHVIDQTAVAEISI